MEHLDYYVIKTLENLDKWEYPKLKIKKDDTNVFMGSGSAACVGRLFADKFNGVSLNVSNYKQFFENAVKKDFASVNVISASGGKDGIKMVEFLKNLDIEPNLITSNKDAPAKQLIRKCCLKLIL